jgi:hypothetical protein
LHLLGQFADLLQEQCSAVRLFETAFAPLDGSRKCVSARCSCRLSLLQLFAWYNICCPKKPRCWPEIETDAVILAMSVFAFIFFRVRLGTRRAGM